MLAISKKFYDMCVGIADNSFWIVAGILIVVTLVIGISLLVSKKSRDNAKEWIPWVLVGTAVAISPVVIAEAITKMAKF